MRSNSKTSIIVNCPTCNKPVEWNDESRWKPFCCERCKLIDLGAWADERYTIPAEPLIPEDLDENNH